MTLFYDLMTGKISQDDLTDEDNDLLRQDFSLALISSIHNPELANSFTIDLKQSFDIALSYILEGGNRYIKDFTIPSSTGFWFTLYSFGLLEGKLSFADVQGRWADQFTLKLLAVIARPEDSKFLKEEDYTLSVASASRGKEFLAHLPGGKKKDLGYAFYNKDIAKSDFSKNKSDYNVAMHHISKNGLLIKDAPLYQNDYNICILAVLNAPKALQYLSPNMQQDYNIVFLAVSRDPTSIIYASADMQANYNMLLLAAMKNPNFYIPGESGSIHSLRVILKNKAQYQEIQKYKDNFTIVYYAVKTNGMQLEHMPEEHKQSKLIVSVALLNAPAAAKFADPSLLEDVDIAKLAMADKDMATYIPEKTLKEIGYEDGNPDKVVNEKNNLGVDYILHDYNKDMALGGENQDWDSQYGDNDYNY